MSLSLFISRRYLFSKKSHNAINIISAISAFGVAFATMAMLCTLSVFNGFHDLISSLYTNFDPQLEVRPAKGKFVDAHDPTLDALRRHPTVQASSDCLEEQAMVLFVGRPVIIHVKGVDDDFPRVSNIDSILTTGTAPGRFLLHAADVEYGIPGIGLTRQFGAVDFGTMPICAPRAGERINLSNPSESFNVEDIRASGTFFQVHQKSYDDDYLITSLRFAQDLFEQPDRISSVALRLKPGTDTEAAKEQLRALAGSRFTVLDRFEQHRETFNVMQIEKTIAYLFLTFIVLVAIFLHESRIITLIGAVVGVLMGLGLCLLQQEFGLLRFGSAAGAFIIDAYPVSVGLTDVLVVLATVLVVGFCTTWWPVRVLTRRFIRGEPRPGRLRNHRTNRRLRCRTASIKPDKI